MGFMSDTEIDFDDDDFRDNTPPSSPRVASSHAEAIAESSKDAGDSVIRDYAALCCDEFGLTNTDKDDILKTSQMATRFMAVRQYIRVVALVHNVNQLLSESFLESAEFRDHVTRRIQATFLDADLPTYVRGCTARLIQHMQENPASWRIPPIVHAHFLNSKEFRKAVAAVASNFRGDMRRKIQKSIKDNLDIGALAKKLCVKGYQPTNEHWRRFALLFQRDYMTDWEKLPCRVGKGRGISFWAFIDTKLDKLRARCVKSTAAETQNAMKTLLKANLKDDQQRFAGPSSGRTKLPARILLPEWQRDHAKAVNDMSEYIVDSTVDDDIDEDDSVYGPDGADAQAAHNCEQGMGDGSEHDANTENRPRRDGNRGAVHVPGVGAGSQNQTGNVRTGVVLVPETQSQDGAQATSDEATNRSITAPNGLDQSSRMDLSPDTQSTQQSFVPATQQQSASLEASRTPGSSGSSSQATQSGWASGTLVDRRPRSTHGSSSPLARPGSSSASQVRRG